MQHVPTNPKTGSTKAPRRSKDLKIIARELMTQNAMSESQFDDFWSALWSYGCHCFDKDTDRPMSTMGFGAPVDKLDIACRNYKRCQACAKEQHGEQCVTEMVQYSYITMGGGDEPFRHVQVSADFESCEHKIFECDHRLAVEFLEYHEINPEFTNYKTDSNWDRSTGCKRRKNLSGIKYNPMCCHNGVYYQWYNSNTRKCCAGKGIRQFDQSCLE